MKKTPIKRTPLKRSYKPHKKTKATQILPEVKEIVYQRDHGICVACGKPCTIKDACSHVLRRSQGGMGIIKNIVTHCQDCHRKYDTNDKKTVEKTMHYIKNTYPDWEREEMRYKKYGRG